MWRADIVIYAFYFDHIFYVCNIMMKWTRLLDLYLKFWLAGKIGEKIELYSLKTETRKKW